MAEIIVDNVEPKVMYSPIHEQYICIYMNKKTGKCTIEKFDEKREALDFKEELKNPLRWYMKEA